MLSCSTVVLTIYIMRLKVSCSKMSCTTDQFNVHFDLCVSIYGGIAFMGASATHLSKFDKVQTLAERISGRMFPMLQSRHAASAIGLLCKLLDFLGRGPLQLFCPNLLILLLHTV